MMFCPSKPETGELPWWPHPPPSAQLPAAPGTVCIPAAPGTVKVAAVRPAVLLTLVADSPGEALGFLCFTGVNCCFN